MSIALVHDQLSEFGGSERVLVALKKIFPKAHVFTLVYQKEKLGSHKDIFKNWHIKTSWFDKIPILRNFYSPFRFLTPFIWESFDFSKYDLVISSSGSWMAKGIKTKKPTIHVSYIHHPPRYLYGYETAIEWKKYLPVRIYAYIVNHFLRIWDFYSSKRPDYIIANSKETQSRIKRFYHRDSVIIYPPVDIPQKLQVTSYKLHNYYLTVSRLSKAKHIDVLIEAANKLKLNLKIVGTGRDENYLKLIAGKTVEFLGNVNDQDLSIILKNAKAFLFASRDEEFGIAPVEAMGYGVPVIAYNSGGIPEYIKNGVNGFLFNQLSAESLIEKIKKFETLDREKILKMKKEARKRAEEFTFERFKKNLLLFLKEKNIPFSVDN